MPSDSTATTSAIDSWLDKTYANDEVKGIILIDPTSGLSLGVRGVGQNSDAPYIRWWCNKELKDGTDSAKIEYREFTILIKVTDQAIIGIYQPLETTAGSGNINRVLSYEGT